jgi:hypothetical protein
MQTVLDGHIWRLAEKVSDRAKARDLAGACCDAEAQAQRSQRFLAARVIA